LPYPVFYAGQRLTAGLLRESQPTFVYKTADESRAQTTFATPDAQLSVPLRGGVRYELSGVIFYSADANCDLQMSSSHTFDGGLQVYYPPVGQTGSSGSTNYARSSSSFNAAGATAGSNTAILAVAYRGMIRTSGDSTFQWQWAQVTSGTVATIVRAGSYIRAEAAF